MTITATDAKNRLGQVLEAAQPVPGDAVALPVASPGCAEGHAFYARCPDWVDEQRSHFDAHGVWNDGFRTW